MPPFIIYSRGRSRTAWLTAFLTYGQWKCYHEVGIRLRSLQDIKDLFSLSNIGILETTAIHARPLIKYVCPEIKEVVILRPLEEVIDSFLQTDTGGIVTWDEEKMHKILMRGDRELRKLAQSPEVLAIEYAELATCEGCKKIFEFCLPYEFNDDWWELTKDQNIQIDMKKFFQYALENKEAIENFKKQLKQELRRLHKMGAITNEMRI